MLFERPGAVELKGDVDDLNERIEELKKLVALKEKEVCAYVSVGDVRACV